MATSGKAREKLLLAQTEQGRKQILAITAQARKEIELKILEATSRGDFVKAAVIRDGLYKGIADEYVKLNRGVDDWTKQRATVVSKAWHTLAIDDLPEAASGATFGQFSKKYLDDIIGKINPSTIGKRVAMNARIEGMLAEDVRAIRTAVSDVIRKGALTGMNYKEMSAEMKTRAAEIKPAFKFVDKAGKTWNTDSYFGMLNRTLHSTVARETYADTMVEAGLDLVRVEGHSTYPDSPCIPWEGEILSLTGATKGYPTMAEAEASGLHHPNCCVPDTMVECPDLQAASRYLYSGEMVKIELSSGNSLTVTPNHMLLTNEGFATARSLTQGDKIISTSKGKRLGGSCPDVNGKPAMISDIFMTLRQSVGVSTAQVPVTPEHFHGDGVFGNGYVDIVSPNGLLLDNLNGKAGTQPIGKAGFVLARSKQFNFSGNSTLASILLCAGHATNRIVSGVSISGAPFDASTLLCKPELFALAPDVYSCGNKGCSDVSDSLYRNLSDLVVSNAGFIELDDVLSVVTEFYSGHVYDLQSLSTLYTANGCLSSNCIHTQSVYIEGVS